MNKHRAFVHLDKRLTRCVVLTSDHTATHKFSAFEISAARKATAYDLRAMRSRTELRDKSDSIALRTRDALEKGDCCYAFYCKPTHQVKLGRTGDLFGRWSKLETEAGRLLQLLAVWHTDTPGAAERLLHDRFAEHRTYGEWFAADPVIDWLRDIAGITQAAR